MFKMLICILNMLRSRIWNMVLFLFFVFWLQMEISIWIREFPSLSNINR
ncbi:hypothetical protein [Anaerobutyricum soehngenii]|nr:hypothetical protein [Anaerobutyricum soehngenii]